LTVFNIQGGQDRVKKNISEIFWVTGLPFPEMGINQGNHSFNKQNTVQ